jgi:hypothetical protein
MDKQLMLDINRYNEFHPLAYEFKPWLENRM